MIPRPDLLDAASPAGAEIIQLTTEQDVPACHIYMEAQIFTPDARRFVLHRSATPHGGQPDDPQHRYMICDLENDCALSPITEEMGATAPSVSPDGGTLYYFVDETEIGGGRLLLNRVAMDGTGRETLAVLDSNLPETSYRFSKPYPLSTISSDGKRLAISGFLGDGEAQGAPWGLIVFDLQDASVRLILHGPTWCNIHPQYARGTDPSRSHDILVQENHGCAYDPKGAVSRGVAGLGADIHVIRDDGSQFRNLPWGRDGNEFCQGHQCWRGASEWAITSTGTRNVNEQQLIEGRASPHTGHVGIHSPGGVRNELSRNFPNASFCHFGADRDGQRLITDAGPYDAGGRIFLTELGRPGDDAAGEFVYLLNPRCTCAKGTHLHPFLSPDGALGFFNSDESGILQAYAVRGI